MRKVDAVQRVIPLQNGERIAISEVFAIDGSLFSAMETF